MEPMKPMKPMEPMEPMTAMEPMKPMTSPKQWWPDDLGVPASSGGQNDMRYAFFPEKHRLLVEQNGVLTSYDSADHRISGVSQQQGEANNLVFTAQDGEVELSRLQQL